MVVVPVVPVNEPFANEPVPVEVKLPTTVDDAVEMNPARVVSPVAVKVWTVRVVPSKVKLDALVSAPAAARYGMRFVAKLESVTPLDTTRAVVEAAAE